MVEIGTGMFDLARWAKEDAANAQSTEDSLTKERLQWYQERIQKFTSLASDAFPGAVKTWRGVTLADDQAAELDYFNVSRDCRGNVTSTDGRHQQDKFGHSPSSVTAYFAPNRAEQMAAEASKLLKPFNPKVAKASQRAAHDLTRRGEVSGTAVHLNPWSELVRGVPAHQLDRLHGGDLATPGAVLWSDIALWHLEQGLKETFA